MITFKLYPSWLTASSGMMFDVCEWLYSFSCIQNVAIHACGQYSAKKAEIFLITSLNITIDHHHIWQF